MIANFTVEAYKSFCDLFISNNSILNLFNNEEQSQLLLEQTIGKMTPEEFLQWRLNFYISINEIDQPVIDFIKHIRKQAGYDALSCFNSEVTKETDPLAIPANRTTVDLCREYATQRLEAIYLNNPVFVKKQNELKEYQKQQQLEASLLVCVDGVEYKALKVIDVLWSGWECDNKAWLVEVDGKNKLVVSNHGQTCFSELSFLEDKLDEYEKAIQNTREMIERLHA